MDVWAKVWGIIFVIALTVFTILAVKVTLGGFQDVLAMLKNIQNQHIRKDNSDSKIDDGDC